MNSEVKQGATNSGWERGVLEELVLATVRGACVTPSGDVIVGGEVNGTTTLDGATVTDADGTMLAVGAILRHPLTSEHAKADGLAEGARTTAAIAAGRFGPVLKVSEDGLITFYDGGRIWDL